jgi:ubiquinone/menaquinone biosynthesis C-methylase UbiE
MSHADVLRAARVSLRDRAYAQFGHPRGPVGRLAGRVMAWENARANALVVELLDLGREDAVLDVGCGPGVAVEAAVARTARGVVVGVDPSPVMVAQARHRNRRAIRAGGADVLSGCAERLPLPAGRFTRALSVNAISHWRNVPAALRELHRVLASDGNLALAFRAQRDAGSPDPHAHGATASEIQHLTSLLIDIGFAALERRDHDLGRETLVTLLARRPPELSSAA